MASVLLLSAVDPSPRPTQKESSQPANTQTQAPTNQQRTRACPSSVPQVGSIQQTDKTGRNAQQRTYQAQQYRLDRLLTWFNGLLALFTFALVVVGVAQAVLLRRAFRAERPYLLIVRADEDFGLQTNAICKMKNFGKGPAVDIRIDVRFGVSSPPFPVPADFSGLIPVKRIERQVVAPDDTIEFHVLASGDPNEVSEALMLTTPDVLGDAKRMTLKGIIRYRDVFKNSYETYFGFLHLPAKVRLPGARPFNNFFMGAEEYNRIT